jgi:SAM-dependent methyltransferase
MDVTQAVQQLYNTYPFPPDPIVDEVPPGYNWRWHWQAAYNFCLGQMPVRSNVRILDAGCGTGVSTEYLVHLNPEAQVTAIDISSGALAKAQERCTRSKSMGVEFHQMSLFDVAQLPGEFDLINSVGVLHHTADPIGGIQALAKKLAPGGLLHIFVYGEVGRWEITMMQKAIGLLQGEKKGDYRDGVQVGREIFANLPETNRIAQREKTRWSMENTRDECFADMYVHPQEIVYNAETIFELIDAAGLEFMGFSNPQFWDLERLIGKAPDLMERAAGLTDRQRYRLIELLDPEVAHFEFFLGRPPLAKADWSQDAALLAAIPQRHPCLEGWPSRAFFDSNYQIAKIDDAEFAWMDACDGVRSVAELVESIENANLAVLRGLQSRSLIALKSRV